MTFVGYLVGVLLHVAAKWSTWKRGNPTMRWRAYWRSEGTLNIAAGAAAIASFALWEAGWIAVALERGYVTAVKAIFGGADFQVAALPITFWTSMLAGYVLDSLARHILGRIERIAGG